MRRLLSATRLGSLVVILALGSAPAVARAPRYAVVNGGPVDHDSARKLLRLYRLLSPEARPAPPRVAARPAPRRKPRRAAAKRPTRKAPSARRLRPRLAAVQLSVPIRGQALRRALVGLPSDEAPAMAAAALAQGKRLFATLQRKKAAEAFARAVSLYDNHVAWKSARGPLVEASKYLLLCRHALGDKDAARQVAARLRELTANQAPKGVPADVWAAYPLVPLPLSPRRILHVKAPPKATVYLDDQLAGQGPQRLPVGPGGHRIRVELAGHGVFHRELAAGTGPVELVVSLVRKAADAFGDVRGALRKVRRGGKPWDPAPIKGLAQQLRIDYLLVCVVTGGSVKARWFSARLGKYAGAWMWLPLPGARPGKLRAPVLASYAGLRDAERRQAKALAETDTQPKKKSSPKLWKKWYFWVAAAVVAGLLAGFAIYDSTKEENVILRVTRP